MELSRHKKIDQKKRYKLAIYLTIQEFHQTKNYSIEWMCRQFKISRAAYYKWLNKEPSQRDQENEIILELLKETHQVFKGLYGSYRLRMAIQPQLTFKVNHKRIERLMRVNNIQSVFRKKKKNNSNKTVKPEEVSENILSRDFNATQPNQKWVTDITEIKEPGWSTKLYISSILDLYDNYPVACIVGSSNNVNLVEECLRLANTQRNEESTLLHSDRGFQYTRKVFKSNLEKQGICHSMSRVSRCIDNGPIESFQGIMKEEMRILFDISTPEKFKAALSKYLQFYTDERPQRRLNGQTPNQVRAAAHQSENPIPYPIPKNYRVEKYRKMINTIS